MGVVAALWSLASLTLWLGGATAQTFTFTQFGVQNADSGGNAQSVQRFTVQQGMQGGALQTVQLGGQVFTQTIQMAGQGVTQTVQMAQQGVTQTIQLGGQGVMQTVQLGQGGQQGVTRTIQWGGAGATQTVQLVQGGVTQTIYQGIGQQGLASGAGYAILRQGVTCPSNAQLSLSASVVTLAACYQQCLQRSGCAFFTYYSTSRQCALFSSCGSYITASSGAITYMIIASSSGGSIVIGGNGGQLGTGGNGNLVIGGGNNGQLGTGGNGNLVIGGGNNGQLVTGGNGLVTIRVTVYDISGNLAPQITVLLMTSANQAVATAVTDARGVAVFTVQPGSYIIVPVFANGMGGSISVVTSTGNGQVISGSNSVGVTVPSGSDQTINIVGGGTGNGNVIVPPGTSQTQVIFVPGNGGTGTGTGTIPGTGGNVIIGGSVNEGGTYTRTMIFRDIYGNPIANMRVDFYYPSGILVLTKTTDASGMVTVSLPQGNYNVVPHYPAGVVVAQPGGTTGSGGTVINTGGSGTTIVLPNGNQRIILVTDSNGMGVPYIRVEFYLNGVLVVSGTTDANGMIVVVLSPGSYRAVFYYSDGTPVYPSTGTGTNQGTLITIIAGQPTYKLVVVLNQPGGGITVGGQTGTIQGTVYVDSNSNSQVNPGEGIPNIVVTLYLGTVVYKETTTTSGGTYIFTGLPAGVYTVVIGVIPGYDVPQVYRTRVITIIYGSTITFNLQVLVQMSIPTPTVTLTWPTAVWPGQTSTIVWPGVMPTGLTSTVVLPGITTTITWPAPVWPTGVTSTIVWPTGGWATTITSTIVLPGVTSTVVWPTGVWPTGGWTTTITSTIVWPGVTSTVVWPTAVWPTVTQTPVTSTVVWPGVTSTVVWPTGVQPTGPAPTATVTSGGCPMANCNQGESRLIITVYLDLDKDGKYSQNDPTLTGVPVTVRDAAGALVYSGTTAADGTTTFADVSIGSYMAVANLSQAGGTGESTGQSIVTRLGETFYLDLAVDTSQYSYSQAAS